MDDKAFIVGLVISGIALLFSILYSASKDSKNHVIACDHKQSNKVDWVNTLRVNNNYPDIHFLDDNIDKYIDLTKLRLLAMNGIKSTIDIPEFVGEELIPKQNINMKYFSNVDADEYIVKCWSIPNLMGRTIDIDDEENLDYIVCKEVNGLGTKITRPLSTVFPFRKYGYVHYSFATDKKSQYDSPMFIELFGVSPIVNNMIDKRPMNNEILSIKIKGSFSVMLIQATWSNVSYPGINVPFYL